MPGVIVENIPEKTPVPIKPIKPDIKHINNSYGYGISFMCQSSSIISGLLTLVRTGRGEGVHAACWVAGVRGVEGQLMAEGLLFAAVCKPIVDAHLSDQVGAQTGQLGRRDTPLDTLRPEDITMHIKKPGLLFHKRLRLICLGI